MIIDTKYCPKFKIITKFNIQQESTQEIINFLQIYVNINIDYMYVIHIYIINKWKISEILTFSPKAVNNLILIFTALFVNNQKRNLRYF